MYDIYKIVGNTREQLELGVGPERMTELTQLDVDNVDWAIEEYGFEATDDYIITAPDDPAKADEGLAVVLNAGSKEQSDPDS